ncbi:MAG: aconitate hydratase AcnA [Chloroflexota bacterium]
MDRIKVEGKDYSYFSIKEFLGENSSIERLPYSIKVLLENMIRGLEYGFSTDQDLHNVKNWSPDSLPKKEIPFMPSRVILQDFTGVPAVVDLATMRDAARELGVDPKKINPLVRSDLVIDHSVQVDFFKTDQALQKNTDLEFKRNRERYQFLKWGQQAFDNLRIVPPGVGIVHQVNLEYLAPGITIDERKGTSFIFPDTCIGTDSHTTMINGLGVLGWGVGGIEAEAVMLGQPYYMKLPEVVGVRLDGELVEGTTATDLVLSITQVLRNLGVVEKFVEFFGSGLSQLSLQDRATIANMAPEYGATCGFFPTDHETLHYLLDSGRPESIVKLVEKYTKEQLLFHDDSVTPAYNQIVDFDLSSVRPSMSGPKRPQDKIFLNDVGNAFQKSFPDVQKQNIEELSDGSITIAAITSCTNTSNPSVMVGAGLLARNLISKGIKPKSWVKTSMAPGSRVVSNYLEKSGLDISLNSMGFNTVGFGCTTCIGNSGPLEDHISEAIESSNLIVASVLSGNRNFEGRIHPLVKANFLASPLLVIAYAVTGSIYVNLTEDSIGIDVDGNEVFLSDVWPSSAEISSVISDCISSEMYLDQYQLAMTGDDNWNNLDSSRGDIFKWDKESTYIQKVPFFKDFSVKAIELEAVSDARALCVLGDSVTTDHISPAGSIPELAPSGQLLISNDVPRKDFNSYGSRRGNHDVMTRGTFGNIHLKNKLTPDKEGDWTLYFPTNKEMRIFDAAEKYKQDNVPLIVIAGKEYGTGSSRDWAAKGPNLLGIKIVIAESYERIHRSNLIGMGIIPTEFVRGDNMKNLGIKGDEHFSFQKVDKNTTPTSLISVSATSSNGDNIKFKVKLRIDTEVEKNYVLNGGVLQFVLRSMVLNSD